MAMPSKLKMYLPFIAFAIISAVLFYQIMNQNNKQAWLPVNKPIPKGAVVSIISSPPLMISSADSSALENSKVDENGAPLNVDTLIQQASEKNAEERELSYILKDEISIVHFFATWCGPCMQEFDGWLEYAKVSPVPIYGIGYKDNLDEVKRLLEMKGNPFRDVFLDDSGQLSIEWGIYGVPETFVIDKNGRIRYRFSGKIDKADFEKMFSRVLLDLNAQTTTNVTEGS